MHTTLVLFDDCDDSCWDKRPSLFVDCFLVPGPVGGSLGFLLSTEMSDLAEVLPADPLTTSGSLLDLELLPSTPRLLSAPVEPFAA